jgi:hypothetical protein
MHSNGATSIPKGCKKVARGKRSEAPGMFGEEAARPERARELSRSANPLMLASLRDAVLVLDASRGCASLAPGYLPASLRDAKQFSLCIVETVY